MRILVTNDDGIHAPGIHAVREALEDLGEVFVIAPERPRSASGHAITLHKPLRITETPLPDGSTGWACSGTPTDCVTLGWDVVMESRVDLVVSGINSGPNLGWDVTYSGTVAAAIEGAILGAPSIAVSVAGEKDPFEYGPAARFTRTLAEQVLGRGMEQWTLLNVNVPAVPAENIRGVSITHQGRRQYVDRIDRRVDPWGRDYYWLRGSLKEEEADVESDVHAVLDNRISVTPIHLDLTAYKLLPALRDWQLNTTDQ
jgi:5'-nucleotidase